jgi:hypothetical protein
MPQLLLRRKALCPRDLEWDGKVIYLFFRSHVNGHLATVRSMSSKLLAHGWDPLVPMATGVYEGLRGAYLDSSTLQRGILGVTLLILQGAT